MPELTQAERRSLNCDCVRLDDVWQHRRGCVVPAVETILAERAERPGIPPAYATPATPAHPATMVGRRVVPTPVLDLHAVDQDAEAARYAAEVELWHQSTHPGDPDA